MHGLVEEFFAIYVNRNRTNFAVNGVHVKQK